jgi:AraC-like DNA-binding protein
MGGRMKDYTNSQICALIDEHIHSDRDRRILKRRLIDGICFEPLAEEFDMSDRQIKRIIYKLQEQLFKHL